MDLTTRLLTMGASGSGSAPTYVEDVFSTWLYTGNGSTQTITNGIDLSGKGGLVWIKSRSSGATYYDQVFCDTVRGNTKYLVSSGLLATSGQQTGSGGTNDITSFNSNGFSLGTDSAFYKNTGASTTYVSWTFRKAAKFFDIVTYTGNGSNRTLAHSLGSVPGCIIVKRTDTAGDWQVYHRSLANTEYLVLNSIAAKATGATQWNSTTPTSTEFSLGTDASVNASGGTYVAYLFAHDAGGFGDSGNDSVVSCGSYTGNGSTTGTGPTVTLGWEPQWVLIKQSSISGEHWYIVDTMRGASESGSVILRANTTSAETNLGSKSVVPTATGFYIGSGATAFNQSSQTYIYIAIRRGPMKTPTDATKVFNANVSSAASGTKITAGFAVDMHIAWERSISVNGVYDRLRGVGTTSTEVYRSLATYSTAAENTSTGFGSAGWDNTGFNMPFYAATLSHIFYSFRRAPGFFDVVAYTGTGSARTVSHNLNVAPELMIVKKRSTTGPWMVYHTVLGNQAFLRVNETSAAYTSMGSGYWNSTTPTSSVFSLGIDADVNTNTVTYIAYLFATCPGVSKCFNYTGTGTTLQINCGFTNGARFVMIKRTDSTGDWYVWDSARGIISGNDPYLLLNSTAAEVTNTDYIDPYSAGFEISSTAPAAINANGGSYIGLAIA